MNNAPKSLPEANQLITEERCTGNGLALSCRVYPCGEAEISALNLSSEDSLKRGGGAGRKHAEKDAMDSATLFKSCSRAKTTVRRKLLTMSADRMLTLTFRENLTDLDEAWRVFKYFAKLMRGHFNHFAYVAVPEYQKRGAVHFHLAVKGFYNVQIVRLFWRRAAGVHGGNIDITSPKKRFGKATTWNPKKLAGYLSKYITKNEVVAFNKRRYSSGGKIQVPEPMRGWLALGMSVPQVLGQLLQAFTHKPLQDYYEFEAYFSGYYAAT